MHVLLLFYLTLQQVTRLIKNFSNNKLFEFILSMILLVIFQTTDKLIIDFFLLPQLRANASKKEENVKRIPNHATITKLDCVLVEKTGSAVFPTKVLFF